MRHATSTNFGLLIAYLLPGFTSLVGIAQLSGTARAWLGSSQNDAPTVGGFLYVTLASVAAGLTASTVRWLAIDAIHHWTGVRKPVWDFAKLQSHANAYGILEENHYRYYQFYANMLVSLAVVMICRWIAQPNWQVAPDRLDSIFVLLMAAFFAGSRDTLQKYYRRVDDLLGTTDGTTPDSGKVAVRDEAHGRITYYNLASTKESRSVPPRNPSIDSIWSEVVMLRHTFGMTTCWSANPGHLTRSGQSRWPNTRSQGAEDPGNNDQHRRSSLPWRDADCRYQSANHSLIGKVLFRQKKPEAVIHEACPP
jgi:hypothetical protein